MKKDHRVIARAVGCWLLFFTSSAVTIVKKYFARSVDFNMVYTNSRLEEETRPSLYSLDSSTIVSFAPLILGNVGFQEFKIYLVSSGSVFLYIKYNVLAFNEVNDAFSSLVQLSQ